MLSEISTVQEGDKLLRPAHPVFNILLGDARLSQLLLKPNQCILQFSSQFFLDHSVQHAWHIFLPRLINEVRTWKALARMA